MRAPQMDVKREISVVLLVAEGHETEVCLITVALKMFLIERH